MVDGAVGGMAKPGNIALIDDDNLKKYHRQILRINVDLSLKYDVDLTVIVENNTDFNLNVDVIPLFKNIYREGINIYAALPTISNRN